LKLNQLISWSCVHKVTKLITNGFMDTPSLALCFFLSRDTKPFSFFAFFVFSYLGIFIYFSVILFYFILGETRLFIWKDFFAP
jgi:FtsH-binding integral membrane protein